MIKKLHLLLIFLMVLGLANAQSVKRIELKKKEKKNPAETNMFWIIKTN